LRSGGISFNLSGRLPIEWKFEDCQGGTRENGSVYVSQRCQTGTVNIYEAMLKAQSYIQYNTALPARCEQYVYARRHIGTVALTGTRHHVS